MRSRTILAACLAVATTACGSAAPPSRGAASVTPDDARRREPAARPTPQSKPKPAAPLATLFKTKDVDTPTELPPGLLIVDASARNRPVPVNPTAIDVASLPWAEIPEPLKYEKAPKALPPSDKKSSIRIERLETRSRSAGNAVYVVLDAKMGRLQIGHISTSLSAGDRVYRNCGDQYYKQPLLTPARWESMTIDAQGRAEYRIEDAWFDSKSCEASVVRTTVIRPKPLLGGLMFAYQTKCDGCDSPHTVTFLAPNLTQLAASGLGGKALASHGNSLSIISLPIRRGGASSFAGTVHNHNLKRWLEGMQQEAPRADLTLGVEITQAVPDETPYAITYATFTKH